MHACWRSLNDACCVVAAQKSAVCVSHKILSWCIKVATESAVRSPLLLSKVCACCQSSLSPVLILLFIRQPTPSMAAWGPSKFLLLPKSPPMPPMRAPRFLLFKILHLLFIWQPTLVEYFTSFFVMRMDMGSLHMCSLLGDFLRMQPLSHLVSNQILFNLLSICSRICLNRDMSTFYMQPCTSRIFSNVCIRISCQNRIRIKISKGREFEN